MVFYKQPETSKEAWSAQIRILPFIMLGMILLCISAEFFFKFNDDMKILQGVCFFSSLPLVFYGGTLNRRYARDFRNLRKEGK